MACIPLSLAHVLRYCSALQCVAVCCSVLQSGYWLHLFSCPAELAFATRLWVAVSCCVLRCVVCVAVCCSVLQCVAVLRSQSWLHSLFCPAKTCICYTLVCCSVLQCVVVCCSVLQRVAACCSVLQRHSLGLDCTLAPLPSKNLDLLHALACVSQHYQDRRTDRNSDGQNP